MLVENVFSLSGQTFLMNTVDYLVYSNTEKDINNLCHFLM